MPDLSQGAYDQATSQPFKKHLKAHLTALKVGVGQHGADKARRKPVKHEAVGCARSRHIAMPFMEPRRKLLHLWP
jgi:hypothetical protein